MFATIPSPLRLLLDGAIDYAGLFPPAGLAMPDAVAEFQACRASGDRWALGRFVLPAGQLGDFAEAARAAGLLPAEAGPPIALSVLATEGPGAVAGAIAAFHALHRTAGVVVESVECRADDPAGAQAAARRLSAEFECWVEIPLDRPSGPLLDAIRAGGGLPKIRTGGTMPEAFPEPDRIIAFLQETVARGLPFKATAGLHHMVRGRYPYTYAPDSRVGPMYGYLNLLLATALLQSGGDAGDARAMLLEENREAFGFGEDGITWRRHRLDLAVLRRVRREGLRAFGSCSFREPLADLVALAVR